MERAGATPIAPPTVLGDAGGALGLAFGIVSGVLNAKTTGKGCVVDASIIDMVAALSGIALWARASGMLDGGRPSIFYDSPFYDAYRCADGRHVRSARSNRSSTRSSLRNSDSTTSTRRRNTTSSNGRR